MSENLEYLRLAEKPGLNHPGYPTCDACGVETELGDGSWLCPSCGTTWSCDHMEADPEDATMYEEWSGEQLTGSVCPNDVAYRFSGIHDWTQREKTLAQYLKNVGG